MAESISARDARVVALHAQGLVARRPRPRLEGLVERVGAVQLDTISVLARSHELVAQSRLGPVSRVAMEQEYWGGGTFEYWAHAACILPIGDWPLFAFRRATYLEQRTRADRVADLEPVLRDVRAALADGPVTTRELGGAKGGGEWWEWTEAKLAIEGMLQWGEVVCTARRGWQRVYDLAERAVPPHLLAVHPDAASCHRALVARAGRHLGVATIGDLADFYRLRQAEVRATVADSGLVPVSVAGWGEPAWADPAALEVPARPRHRTTLLSPFDPMVWHRPRGVRLFGFDYRLESYVPAPKRVYGYFAMPILAGGRVLGLVDPGRRGRTMLAKRVTLFRDGPTPAEAAAVAEALTEAARWVGSETVELQEVSPAGARPALAAALDATLAAASA